MAMRATGPYDSHQSLSLPALISLSVNQKEQELIY